MSPLTLVMLGSTLILPPTVAPSVDPGNASAANGTTIAVAAPADARVISEPAEPAVQGGASGSGGRTQITWRGQAGLFFVGGDTGFMLGGGGGAYPFSNKQVEVTGDLHFARIASTNGVYASGNGLYHFKTSSMNLLPFAGAGLGFDHFSDNTDVNLQILGGLAFNQAGKYPMRVDVRFLFTEGDTTTILMLGVKLGAS